VELSVGEAAAKVRLSVYTLRWYEEVGLLDPISRDGIGRRRYAERDIARLEFLNRLRSTGMSVRDMRRYVDLVRQGPATADARQEVLRAHRDQVLGRIADLQRDLDVIEQKIKMYESKELT
jgi:DNA-binding transcriptional MerR regulator